MRGLRLMPSGDHSQNRRYLRDDAGLSPLTRGTRPEVPARLLQHRFIPADAGNTYRQQLAAELNTVYPRWRGEHMDASITATILLGLSPLARGTPGRNHFSWSRRRFIPAGAGNTAHWLRVSPCHAVYPRWRGEHFMYMLRKLPSPGLSPLARGTRNRKVE